MKHLTIISHTEHYNTSEGTIVGLGSTVMEINHLLEVFDRITHVAMLHSAIAPSNALPYVSDRITFVSLPAVGGPKLSDKLSILTKIPEIIRIIRDQLKETDYFQFRAPTGIGVVVIPYLMLFCSKKGWFKYAGNWKQEHAPMAYRIQKWLLEHQTRKVTINGRWEHQPKHCLSFENPCLTTEELSLGQSCILQKSFKQPLNLCFVGRLEPAKGVDLILETIGCLPDEDKLKIGKIHIVGGGKRLDFYKKKSENLDVNIIFHDVLSRTQVHDIYKDSHAILLPSGSEGFPKVIAEAMNYGCIPIVSDISAIGHYVRDGKNGILLNLSKPDDLKLKLSEFLKLPEKQYHDLIVNNPDLVKTFTYSYYNNRLITDVL